MIGLLSDPFALIRLFVNLDLFAVGVGQKDQLISSYKLRNLGV